MKPIQGARSSKTFAGTLLLAGAMAVQPWGLSTAGGGVRTTAALAAMGGSGHGNGNGHGNGGDHGDGGDGQGGDHGAGANGQGGGQGTASSGSDGGGGGPAGAAGNTGGQAASGTPASAAQDSTAAQADLDRHGNLQSALGALNAAHASPSALAHASPESRVGRIAAYQKAMLAALAMPHRTRRQIEARRDAIARARRVELADAANKPLSPMVVAEVDRLLGLPRTNPALGVPH